MKLLVSTKQFKMYLSDEVFERLKTVAEKYGKGSGQAVVEELISYYLPVWVSVNEATRRAVDAQTQEVAGVEKFPVGRRVSIRSKKTVPGKLKDEIHTEAKRKAHG